PSPLPTDRSSRRRISRFVTPSRRDVAWACGGAIDYFGVAMPPSADDSSTIALPFDPYCGRPSAVGQRQFRRRRNEVETTKRGENLLGAATIFLLSR
ncbi:hypothetical protein A2U01_0052491, partial [Trifolium medium]|nr:hypothetical protein [Trifolium medium]